MYDGDQFPSELSLHIMCDMFDSGSDGISDGEQQVHNSV